MVRAAFDNFCDVLRLLVDGHGSDDAAMWRRGGQLDLDWTGLGNLTVELLQQRRVLDGKITHTSQGSGLIDGKVLCVRRWEKVQMIDLSDLDSVRTSQSVSHMGVQTNASCRKVFFLFKLQPTINSLGILQMLPSRVAYNEVNDFEQSTAN